jgi:hypothetical protein
MPLEIATKRTKELDAKTRVFLLTLIALRGRLRF